MLNVTRYRHLRVTRLMGAGWEPSPEYKRFIKHMGRCLADGGRVFVRVYNEGHECAYMLDAILDRRKCQ